jgi:hypothetical protein
MARTSSGSGTFFDAGRGPTVSSKYAGNSVVSCHPLLTVSVVGSDPFVRSADGGSIFVPAAAAADGDTDPPLILLVLLLALLESLPTPVVVVGGAILNAGVIFGTVFFEMKGASAITTRSERATSAVGFNLKLRAVGSVINPKPCPAKTIAVSGTRNGGGGGGGGG